MSWFNKLKSGLSKSSNKITESITSVVAKRKLDDEALEEIEEALITADLGVETAAKLTASLAKERFDKEVSDLEIRQAMANDIAEILAPVAKPLDVSANYPHVILVVGVNGNGKTTTIGKLANYLQKDQGKRVMLAACDTFRAAAVEQLQIWGQRNSCDVVTGSQGADPASVAFQAFEKAQKDGADVVLIDTAGRLQTNHNLMEELSKIARVLKKIDPSAPHDTLLVLDATTGQNAHSQAQQFGDKVPLSGMVITKLDGSAKGGVVVALANSFKLPIIAVGVGEAIDDLKPFDANEFANSLMGVT